MITGTMSHLNITGHLWLTRNTLFFITKIFWQYDLNKKKDWPAKSGTDSFFHRPQTQPFSKTLTWSNLPPGRMCLDNKVHIFLSDDSDIIYKAMEEKKATVDIFMLLHIYEILGSLNTMRECFLEGESNMYCQLCSICWFLKWTHSEIQFCQCDEQEIFFVHFHFLLNSWKHLFILEQTSIM